ncbi:Cadherin domain protein [Gimesia maris]|uniref:LamG-like jellyroll fold domain-containing protein n=1 Tax=Gimesia maris TaxID=122 RepID=UPI00118B7114|nr:LamG-like jellyroll fold domain-containing protein [Gimesia maris]QDT79612.1 Cadherin domain protein [Gimesia maris]
MRFIKWLNRCLGKSHPTPNLEFNSLRQDRNADLELVRLEDRIVLNVSAVVGGVSSDVLELNLTQANDEATVSVVDGGATLQVDDGQAMPGSILQFDMTQISSILVTGTDPSQTVQFLGQEPLVLTGSIDLTGFTGDVNIGIQLQVDPGTPPQFSTDSTVTYLAQFELTNDQLNVILPNQLNADDAFVVQINGSNLEILDPDQTTPLLFSTPAAGVASIHFFGSDGESDLLTLDYSNQELTEIAIIFDGGTGGNDALEFMGGTFATVTHNLTGPGSGSIDISGNGITEISYTGLEPVFGGDSTADNIVINLPAGTLDAVLEDSVIPGEMQIRSVSSAFELTTFAVPSGSLTINTSGGNSIVTLDSFDTDFAPTSLILSGNTGDTYQLTASDLLADTVSLTLAGGATLDLDSYDETVNNFILEEGTVIATTGVLTAQSNLDLRSGTVQAQLSGIDLVKNGPGTVILDALNGYTGQTIINDGTLQLAQSYAIPGTSGVNLTSITSVLDLDGFELSITSLTGTGSVLLGGASGTLTVNSPTATSATYAGDISGDGSLIKMDDGELILSGTSSYTGSTSVINGALIIDGSLTTAEVTVDANAVLGGSGVINADVTVHSDGSFLPGSSPGFISTEYLTLEAGSALDVEINGTTAGSEYDQVQVTGEVNLTGAKLNISSTFTAAAGTEFLLIDNDDVDSVTGEFVDRAEGTLFTFNGNQVYITYQGGDGNDVVLIVNSPPVADNQAFSIDENTSNTTSVGTIVATDVDVPPDSLTFSLTGGSGQTAFDVSSMGEITVLDQTQLDYETATSYELEILVTDSAGATDTATITINLNPLNDNSPVIVNQIRNVDENSVNGTSVGAVIVATDEDLPGDTLTFTESGGTGSAAFDITSDGQIIVVDQSLLNFETNPTYTLDVIVDDNAGSTATATITINLNDLAETLVVNPTDWAVDDITIIRDGSQIQILETGTSNEIVPSHAFDKVTDVQITGNGSNNILRIELSEADIAAIGGINFNGGAGSNTIVAPNQDNDWEIDGINSGSLLSGAVVFSNVENLTGNDAADTFAILDSGQIDGTIAGGVGSDSIDFSAVTAAVTVNLNDGSATGINLATGIEKYIGDGSLDNLTGITAGTTYVIDGVNQGSVAGIAFEAFNHLVGTAGVDTFQFSGSGQITGSIDGLTGNDVLDYSTSSIALNLVLSAIGTTDGFSGSESSTLTSFDNINTIAGSANTDSLTGIDATAAWSIDGTNEYTSTNTLDFNGFENLSGGTQVDTFTITGSQSHNLAGNSGNDVFAFADGATLTGTIDGQAGSDRLDYSLNTSSINVTLTVLGSFDGHQGTESSISGGFDNINQVIAGSGTADQLTGRNAAATWSIGTSNNYGSTNSLGFSSFEQLQGGSESDLFTITGNQTVDIKAGAGNDTLQFSNNGSTLNGTFDGQDGTDHLNLSSYTVDLDVTLSALGGTDGFDGTEANKSVTFANIDEITGGSGTNSLTGINGEATWTLTGANTYQSINALDFSSFINLTGGSAADIFNVTPDTEAYTIAGGDPTSNPLGDQLNIDTSTAGTAVVSSNGDGSGSVTGTFPTVAYSEIENFAISGEVDIQLDGSTNNDQIEILVSGTNIEYYNGGILIGTSTLTATNIINFNGGDGDDSLTVDTALAAEGIVINYDGQGQITSSPGDVLNLVGTAASVEYYFADSSSGSIQVNGSLSDFIIYSGLEPITSSVTTTNVTLNYSGVDETITVTDAGGGQTTVDSTAGEIITFADPTGTLTINTGAGEDIIDLDSLSANFTANLIINGEGDADTLNANGSISLDTGKNLEFNVEDITVANGITLAASSIAFNATSVELDGDLVSTNVSGDAATINVSGSAGGADLQDAVDIAGAGGIINIAAGSYLTNGTLEVDESVSLLGAGQDVVEIRKAGAPTGTYDIAVNVSADNVTISGAQLGWEIHTSATDYRGYVLYTSADFTTLNNLLFGDNYRSAVVFEGADNLEVSDSIFEGIYGRAAIRDGNSGSGENFLITRNEFREDHFRWGPISIGPQGTFGDPYNNAFSGVISYNYFGNGLIAGDFQEAGDQNYTLTITNGSMTADGIDIVHNTFDWQDSAVTNGNGIYAQPGGIYFDPALAVAVNTVNITDNIFNGFSYDGPQPTTDPLWNPAGGKFGGALEFDGVDDFGLFQDASFDVGTAGTLSFWVNMDDQGRRNQFFEGPNNGGMEFQYRTNGGGQFFGSPNRNDGNGNTYVIQNGSAGGTTGVWQNIQYTWDFNGASGPEMHLYIDGTEVGYLSGTYDADLSQWTATVSTVNELMNVGRDPGDITRFFDGLMDDVAWFNEALDQADLDTIRTSINGAAALSGDGRMVAHWDFDETTGNIATDNVSGIEMLISTNGIVPFGPEFKPGEGQFDGALEFDGIDDFATFQDASFDVGYQGTLNFWVKMDDTGKRNQLFEGPENGGMEFQYRTNGGGQFYGRTQDGSDFTIQNGGQASAAGVWTNIQYTWDADTGEMHIYIDGVEDPYLSGFDENLSGFDSTHFTDTINGLMNVGRDPGDPARAFDGLMDDIGWFNEVLSETERLDIMNNSIGGSALNGDPRLVAYWNLDDTAGTTIAAGNGGTTIQLYIQAEPPLPPIQGFGVLAPLNANVTYNTFNGNDLDSNVTLDATNTFGDPLFAYANDPNYVPTDSLEEQFTIGFGSAAAYGSSEFDADTNTTTPHIGAYQNPPTLYPGIYGTGDIVVYGTGQDDLLEITFTSENEATFVLTRDVTGTPVILDTVVLTDITSITFNGLDGDDVLVLNQPDNGFANPSGGIFFNGGSQNNDGNYLNNATGGDTLVLNHAVPLEADSVAYVFTPDTVPAEGEDGVITISDVTLSDLTTTISFTGLEPIIDNLLVSDRDFDFTDADEIISLSDDGNAADNYSYIDSTLSESVRFLNPTTSITIRTDSLGTPVGVDTIQVDTLDSLFDASLTILAGADDSVTFQTTTNLVTGDLLITAESVDILADISAASVDISTSGVTSTTFNGGTVSTTGSQLYNNAVNFVTNSTLTSSNGDTIEFVSTVDGSIDLVINTTGSTIFGDAVGNTLALTTLTTNTGGITYLNGGIVNTTGSQIYNDDVILGANTVLTSTATADIIFNMTLNGTFALEINTDSDTTFNGTVGNDSALTSLITDANGITNINGGSIDTIGSQTFNDEVLLGDDTRLESTSSGNITFNSLLDGSFNLVVNTVGNTNFEDIVGNTAALTSLTTNTGGTTNIDGGIVRTTGSQTYHDDMVLGVSTVFTSNTTGDITYNASVTGGAGITVDISSTNDININGAFTTDEYISATAGNDILITALVSSTNGPLTFLADNDIHLTSTGSIVAQSSSLITLTADNDNSSAGAITLDSGSSIESQGGQILMSAYDDVALSSITTTGGLVDITSTNGGITDNDSTGVDNVTASQLIMNSNLSIGQLADAIDTSVSFLEADAGTGGLFLDNTGNLTIGGISTQVGLDADVDMLVNVTGTLNITEDTQSTTGSVTFNASDTLTVDVTTTVSTFNAGVLLLTSTRNIKLNSGSNLKTVNGGITLQANTAGTTSGDFTGIEAENAGVTTSGLGSINLTGFGGLDAGTSNHYGVHLHSGTTVSSTDIGVSAGTININGTGGTGIDQNSGVYIEDAGTTVKSVDGTIEVTGNASSGVGFLLVDQAEIVSSGTGVNAAEVIINGTTSADLSGVEINSNIQSTDGAVSITGISTGAGSASEGVLIQTAAGQVISVNGTITIDGSSNGDDGIEISDNAVISASGTGNIELLGNSTGTGNGIDFNATIKSNTGFVTLTAEDDILFGSVALIDSTSGTVTLIADNAAGNNGDVISMTDGSLIDAGTGDISLTTDGNVLLAGLLTTGTVKIDSLSASILDNGDTHTDITSSITVLNAVTGIGTGNPLETAISTLSATVSEAGSLLIDNSIAIVLLDLSTFDGEIVINSTDTITATSVVSTNDSNNDNNDITLTATGSSSDILVTAITAVGNADVILTADDGILDTATDGNRITADDLQLTSSSAGLTADGIEVDTDVNSITAEVNTNAGGIHIDEVDSVTLTQLTTFDGFITVNAAGTINAININSINSSASDINNGITLTATGVDSDILVTTLNAQNTADISLNSDRDVLDSDSSDSNLTTGDLLTIVAGRNVGGVTNVFTEAGFDPLQTTVDHMDITSGSFITLHNLNTTPELLNLDAGTGSAGTTFIKVTGGAIDVSTTTGISNTQDTIALVSDDSITVPTGLQTGNLRLDAPIINDAGGGDIDINAVDAILFQSESAETVQITAQRFDGTTTGSELIINNDSPALELVDVNSDSIALLGGTDTDVSLTSVGTITISNLVQTQGTGTLFLKTTDTAADLVLDANIQSETGFVTIETADDIIFNGTTNLTSTSGSVSLTADADAGAGGGITMNDGTFINAGDGTVSLDATDDIELSQITTLNATATAIRIETDSSLIDSGDSMGEDLIANESGALVTIIATQGVGKVADANQHIEMNVDQINIVNATAGEIQIIETDALIVHDIIQTTAGDIRILAGGDVTLTGLIETVSNDVLIDSQAAIIDQNDGLPDPLNIRASSLNLNAATGIGIGDTLEFSAMTFSADTTTGDILLHNTAYTAATATSLSTAAGNLELEQIGNESLTIDFASTLDGNIIVSNTGDAQTDLLTLTSIAAGGTTPEITISTVGFGHILLGSVTGLDGVIAITSAGEINDAVDDQGAPEIDVDATGGSITLQAENGIGNADPVENSGGTLSVNTTTGNIDLSNTSSTETGDVSFTRLTTGLGTIDFQQTGGRQATFEEVATTDSAITIISDGSMLFENPGILTNVVSTDGAGTIAVTATGLNSSIQVNDGFSTVGGTIDLTAQNSLNFGTEGDINSVNGQITLLADSASLGAGGGGISLSDGTVFDAGTGTLDLHAGDNIDVGQLITTTFTRLTSTNGGVTDSGDTGGRDITSSQLVIRTATGAGSANSIETAVSLLAGINTDAGSIQINNNLGGGLLTIGTVDGVAGITNSADTPGDIIISNASPLTVDSPVTNSSGGNIDLESTGPGDLTLNSPVRAFGGNGNINVEAGDGILDINDTGNTSDYSVAGTGIFSGHGTSGVSIDSNTTLNSQTGAIAGLPPDLRNIMTPQILPTGVGTVTGDFGRFSEQNFYITIDWGDGTIETFNFDNPGSFEFQHTYAGNPNSQNPAADIPILVTMQGDKQFTFSDGNNSLDFTVESGLLETPGEGLATVAIDTTPQVPLLIFPQQEVILDSTSNFQSIFTNKDTQLIDAAINEANKNAERLVFLRILAPNGDLIEDVALQESDLDNLPKLFQTLPDGRYQIYLKEAGEERVRLLMDVDIRNGKASDVTEEQSAPPTEPDPGNDTDQQGMSQLNTEDPLSEALRQIEEMVTVIRADSEISEFMQNWFPSESTYLEGAAEFPRLDSSEVMREFNKLNTRADQQQTIGSEQAWSSAALLSGYFHGKSLLKKPATTNERDTALEKYGNRLLNRRYNIYRNNP